MSRNKLIFMLCLGALSLPASLAPTASAELLHECTAFGSGGTGIRFAAGCTKLEAGGPAETKPLLFAPQSSTQTGTGIFSLSSIIGGVSFTIQCTGEEGSETVENGESGGVTFARGEGADKFTGCSVTAPAGKGCTVPATIETVKLSWKTNGKDGTKVVPASGETFVTIPVTKCSVGALNGEKVIKGSASSETETVETQAFTSTSGSALTFGGQTATFIGKKHRVTPNGIPLAFEKP